MDTMNTSFDGYLDCEPIPGPQGAVTFSLLTSPTDDRDDDISLICTSGHPKIINLLGELNVGDLLRVNGTLSTPKQGRGGEQLEVEAIEVLEEVPARPAGSDRQASQGEAGEQISLGCYGSYVTAHSSAASVVHVWHESGSYAGTAADLSGIDAQIAAWEANHTGD